MKMWTICSMGILSILLAASPAGAQAPGASNKGNQAGSIPLEKLVMATCRQAWQMGGRNQDGFFDIVQQLTALSAQNRHVTLPDDKAVGARAGEWIRTEAIKDPDQLLYAVVDHAVQHSIAVGRAKPAAAPAVHK